MKRRLASALSLVALLVGCSKPSSEVEHRPAAVRVAKVKIGDIVEGRSHLAEVVPERSVRIVAQVPGTVTALTVAEGASVKQRSTIVRVSAPDVAARVTRIRADRKRAEKERDFACEQVITDRVLAKSGDLSSVQLDRSEKGCAAATLSASAASAGEREASVARSRSVERAPFDGEVLIYLVDEGQTVMPGSPLLEYGSKQRRLRLRLPDRELADVKVGTRIESPLGGGKVVEIGAKAVGPGRLVDVFAVLDSPTRGRVGSTLTVQIVVAESSDACAVPRDAIAQGEKGSYVLVVSAGGELRQAWVETGPKQDGWVAIVPALPSDTQVATGAIAGLDLNEPVFAVSP